MEAHPKSFHVSVLGKLNTGTSLITLIASSFCINRRGEWQDAKKLCEMILIYEPDNPEALEFFPMIEERIKVRFLIYSAP